MKLGMPTLLELDTLDRNIEMCESLGLDFLEINMNLPMYQTLSRENFPKNSPISYTFHLPEDLDIAHFHDQIRKTYWGIIDDTLALMSRIGSTKLNMHLSRGIFFTLPHEKVFLYEKYHDQYCANIQAFADEFEANLSERNIILCVENTGNFHIPFIQDALRILLTKDHIRLTWDIGHDFKNGQTDGMFLKNHLEKLSHMHVHDATSKEDHLELSKGNIDIASFKDLSKRLDLDMVIETKTVDALVESVRTFRDI